MEQKNFQDGSKAMTMKKVLSFIVQFSVITLVACAMPIAMIAPIARITELSHPKYVQKLSGLNISGSTIVSARDTHGGFHGDGELIVTFDCAQIADSIASQIADWNPLPMTDNLQNLMYGGGLADKFGISEVTNGYYFFWDRHSECTDPTSDSELNDRSSWNFTLMIYDADHSQLYLFELDT
ncbi:MAG: hypothetical protein IKM11_06025 [Oscillospiraceae bacterium]|nr:hypothetical protein [Oscillospiraceae bacterium]